MARAMREPSEAELPRGTVRDFVEVLFRIYRDADRPSLQKVSDTIAGLKDCRGTASTETIRKMLHGKTVPPHWSTVEAVVLGLCALAGQDIDSHYFFGMTDASLRSHVRDAWHKALDRPDLFYGTLSIGDDDPVF